MRAERNKIGRDFQEKKMQSAKNIKTPAVGLEPTPLGQFFTTEARWPRTRPTELHEQLSIADREEPWSQKTSLKVSD